MRCAGTTRSWCDETKRLPAGAALGLAAPVSAQEVVDVTEAETVVKLYDTWRFQEADQRLAELARTHPGEPHTLYAEGYARFLSGDYPAAVAKLKLADAGMPVKDLLLLAEARRRALKATRNGARRIS